MSNDSNKTCVEPDDFESRVREIISKVDRENRQAIELRVSASLPSLNSAIQYMAADLLKTLDAGST